MMVSHHGHLYQKMKMALFVDGFQDVNLLRTAAGHGIYFASGDIICSPVPKIRTIEPLSFQQVIDSDQQKENVVLDC